MTQENSKSKIFEFIHNSENPISRALICSSLNISESTAKRHIAELIAEDSIEKIGNGPSVAYAIDAADLYLKAKQLSGNKEPIHYDYERLGSFVPNISSYFKEEQRKSIESVSKIPTGLTHDEYLSSIQRKMLLETSWASSVLEGNTYSLIDTEELFEHGNPKNTAHYEETQMLLNHKHAIEYVLTNLTDIEISKFDVLNIHAMLSEGLMKDPTDVGRLRQKTVGIGQSTYCPLDVPYQISEEFDSLLDYANMIEDPFDKSFYLLINIAYLQPFTDVNKRTSRIVSNIPLLKAGLMPMSFFQTSKVGYEKGILHYYETGDFNRLAKEYVKGYVISAERFQEILSNKPTENEMKVRLKFRKEISKTVKHIVSNMEPIDRIEATFISDDKEREIFISYVSKIIKGLNPSNIILYGLSSAELKSYAANFDKPEKTINKHRPK